MPNEKFKNIAVAMSGGVDSSVSVALLKEAGYNVTGVFIRVWEPPFLECDWPTEREDARRVAAHLDIPFSTIDLRDEYKKGVVDYMIHEYARGRTPNPDVMCNFRVKFGAFFEAMRERGFDAVATGHYAQVRDADGVHRMYAGVDQNKDQSYFLWTLSQDVLTHTMFPVGHLAKDEVRKEAERLNLPVAQKKDSQGVCFLGHVDMRDFLKRFIDVEPGDVLDIEGNVIGTHEGALLYTIGQRRGFTVTKKTSDQAPLFVVSKDTERNTITVATEEMWPSDLEVQEVELEGVSWTHTRPADGAYHCRYRHRQAFQECVYEYRDGKDYVTFTRPQRSVSPGQSLVLYSTGEAKECYGGGVIAQSV